MKRLMEAPGWVGGAVPGSERARRGVLKEKGNSIIIEKKG